MTSYGIMVCADCRREVHQLPAGWIHCEDSTSICEGSKPVYPQSKEEIKGAYCGRDGELVL
jgi:hypothetical protein